MKHLSQNNLIRKCKAKVMRIIFPNLTDELILRHNVLILLILFSLKTDNNIYGSIIAFINF